MIFFIIAGLALVIASAIYFVCRWQEDFYLDQKHVEKDSSLRRFVRFGTVYVAVSKSNK
ncbi:hypothetical protein ACFW35_13105 [Fictibacillus sp. NPDC058756]|uniref:hypothetical protein n=1 Tax=Fictibacillus sp. NPDC058756 TaxID=3346625 RepID=UPI0036CE5DBE